MTIDNRIKFEKRFGWLRFLVDVEPDKSVDVSDVDDDLPRRGQDGEAAPGRLHAGPIILGLP